jgi:hypothetical protein
MAEAAQSSCMLVANFTVNPATGSVVRPRIHPSPSKIAFQASDGVTAASGPPGDRSTAMAAAIHAGGMRARRASKRAAAGTPERRAGARR